jgi:transcription elongation GreA/GreB family factor
MTKEQLLQQIRESLTADLAVFSTAARAAHEAATHEQCIPDNKYDTTALEASYIAQGQANRAQEIRLALESFRTLELRHFDKETPIRLTALVTLEDNEGVQKQLFLGPAAGGLKITEGGAEIVVITPHSPMGRALIGKVAGDELQFAAGTAQTTLLIVNVC